MPAFTAALFAMLHDELGYQALVLEQGPRIVARLANAAVSGGIEALVREARTRAGALHFKTFEELPMIASVASAGNGAESVWGIDRALSPALVLEEIAAADAGQVSTDAASLLRELEETKIGSKAAMRLIRKRARESEAFVQARFDGGPVGALVELLVQSVDNLALFGQGDKLSRQLATAGRENLLKEQLSARLKSAETSSGATPRVLLRFGHMHVGKSGTQGNTESLGAFVDALARKQRKTAFFVNIQVLNPPGKYWSLTDYPGYKLLTDGASLDEWRIIDLRPLRAAHADDTIKLNPTLRNLVGDFDAILMLGGASLGSTDWLRKE